MATPPHATCFTSGLEFVREWQSLTILRQGCRRRLLRRLIQTHQRREVRDHALQPVPLPASALPPRPATASVTIVAISTALEKNICVACVHDCGNCCWDNGGGGGW